MSKRRAFLAVLLLCMAGTGCRDAHSTLPASEASRPASGTERPANGDRIVFQRGDDLFSIKPNADSPRRLAALAGIEYVPEWSPDRSKIAFLRARKGATNLWVMRHNGDDAYMVARDVVEHYDWAPDSRLLVFTRSEFISYEEGARNTLFSVRPDGSEEQLLSDEDWVGFGPDWSPDGSSIALTGLTRPDDDMNEDVYLFDVEDGDVRQLTTDPDDDWAPQWSPDGTKIAFLTARNDPYDSEFGPYTSGLYVIDADGSNERQLTSGDHSKDSDHAWSPDGRHLVYVQGWDDDVAPETTSHLRIVSPHGPSERVAAGGRVAEPDWSPSGSWIVYQRQRNDIEIMRIRPEGSAPMALTDNEVHDTAPDW